jgi:two-component system response regulator PilR (NtrC family)
MSELRALIIDDEPDILELLELTLNRMNIETCSAVNLEQAQAFLKKERFNLCLTDMRLPDGNGIDLVHLIQDQYPSLPVAIITAHGNMDTAIHAMKAGAFDFVTKPVDLAALRRLVSTAVQSSTLPETPADSGLPRIIGKSEPMLQLSRSIRKLARSQAPVYISGESGSGKELVARSIHELGPRAAKTFVPVNCGAIPRELMESEFFGHKKGAFTGATHDKQGLFQAAEGGTLFLDEVADLPLAMQVKLLRAIQEKAVRPVGVETEQKIDVRILCATHKNLEHEVAEGNFRQDLFYRLNVIQLSVPPLRDRPDDVLLLSENILARLAEEMDLPCPHLHRKAEEALLRYHFPGNVRELENILERAFTLCEGDVIGIADLQLTHNTAPLSQAPGAGAANHSARCAEHGGLDDYLQEIEKEVICDTLERMRWNKTLTAKELGITFRSLRYRLQKLGLDGE